MKPFKKGAFTMAIATQLPVLPLSLHGSYEAWPPGRHLIRGGLIRVVLDKAIETEGLSHSDTGDLRDQVQELISARVSEMGGVVSGG
jgi:1-acyl-sn-glycerol-3-phosphate acyltransferase